MNTKQKLSLLLPAIVAVLAGLIALSAVTYAWFSAAVGPYTNVTPMEGKISKGEGNLLISESRDGPFDRQCPLNPTDFPEELQPVSTADLDHFYTAIAQDRQGYSVSFRDVSREVGQWLIRGTVYLQNQGQGCKVYLSTPELEITGNPQILDAGRLGLRITTGEDTVATYIFALDYLGSTEGAQLRQTVAQRNAVIAGIDAQGAPTFVGDPAHSIQEYHLENQERIALVSLDFEEIAQVDYWLYLEGCDDACSNPVQSQDITLQLGFAGEPVTEKTNELR